MTDAGGDGLAELTTTPILDDRLYLAEALLLREGENEEDIDAQLIEAARKCGIEDPDLYLIPKPAILDVSTALSNMSLKSEQRSSLSIHSRETQSTTQTSLPSRHSRDKSPMSRIPPPLVRASFSVDRSNAVPDSPRMLMRHGRSSSEYSTAMSLPNTSTMHLHSSRKTKRASALFSMFRKELSACPSRSHRHVHHFKSEGPKLQCGHSLSKYAIRVHVQEALEKRDGAAPMCCGQPLPRNVLAIVLTNAEVELVADNILPSPDQVSLRDSGYSENGMSSVDLPRILDTEALVSEPYTMPATPTYEFNVEEAAQLGSALECVTFQELRTQQKEQFRRISIFEAKQRQTLLAERQSSLDRLAAQTEALKNKKAQQHVQQLERLEEFQLRMEHDLREAHTIETRNVATALKYMEAYCLGPNPAHPEISYAVTDEDRKKLERQHFIQRQLPAKHDSAINVLRAKQERDTKIRLQKQQAELEQLEVDYEKDKSALDVQYEKDSDQLDATIEMRRSRVARRWELKFEIWRRQWEMENGTTLHGSIPHEDWPQTTDTAVKIDSLNSLAV